ncbi:MAG: hypothetical protein H6727_02730 [Myxococcales bacterium]|nr:hypothetical protein [Myxococcales bacterium]
MISFHCDGATKDDQQARDEVVGDVLQTKSHPDTDHPGKYGKSADADAHPLEATEGTYNNDGVTHHGVGCVFVAWAHAEQGVHDVFKPSFERIGQPNRTQQRDQELAQERGLRGCLGP